MIISEYKMNISYNTNGDLKYINKLHVCRPQKHLYKDTLFGIINEFGINISKLRLSLISLFPAVFECLSLEFLNVEENIKDKFNNIKHLIPSKEEINKLDIRLRLMIYYKLDNILCIDQYCEYVVPLLSLPKLSFSDTIIVDKIEKVFVSQLSRNSGIRIIINNNVTKINLLNPATNTLTLLIKNNDCKIICGEKSSEYLMTLISLGVKYSHLLKITSKISFLKKLNYTIHNIKYGRRRIIRFVKLPNGIALNSDTHNFSKKYQIDGISKIIASDISSIKLPLSGRDYFNSLINEADYGLDLVTKKDLISIWNNFVNLNYVIKSDNSNVRIIRGIGDIIIEIIEDVFIDILHPNIICYTFESVLWPNQHEKQIIETHPYNKTLN